MRAGKKEARESLLLRQWDLGQQHGRELVHAHRPAGRTAKHPHSTQSADLEWLRD